MWEAVRDESFGVFILLVLLPLAVYLASYGRWFTDNGVHFTAWLKVQKGMLDSSVRGVWRITEPGRKRLQKEWSSWNAKYVLPDWQVAPHTPGRKDFPPGRKWAKR